MAEQEYDLSEREYDLLVIGAGPAGSEAATNAVKLGVRVALVERHKLGGTCLNYGCDPTDTLLQIAHLNYRARHAQKFGLSVTVEVNWATAQKFVQQVMTTIRGGSEARARAKLEQQGIDLFEGDAKFISPHEVEVAGQVIHAKRIVIATGVQVVAPPIDGLQEAGYITHVEAVSLPELPRSIAIMGSGAMAVEFSQLFHRFGVQVTVLESGDELLPGEDREMADCLCAILSQEGIRFEANVAVERIARDAAGKHLHLRRDEKAAELIADEILMMLPRRPVLDSLTLGAARVQYSATGIPVSATMRTNVRHIFAAGDVTGGHQFSNRAAEQGKLAARNAFAKRPRRFKEPLVPWILSTDPALTHIGKTEEELRARKIAYRAARLWLKELDRAIMNDETNGLVKLLVGEDDKILGAHILASTAGDMLAPVALAMNAGLPITSLAATILPYPTMAEAVRWAAEKIVSEEEM